MRSSHTKTLKIYIDTEGKCPLTAWLEGLKDKSVRYRIKARLDRLADGNMGDCKYISNGVSELRFSFGAGYRIYYGEQNSQIVLLLCGGNKSTQKKDIKRAIEYWQSYLER
ncbi:MAG: type II toxin-antitoxin system RelE/ParE family toxin [Gammaproteobacteria bacterium]|nr:type II toxin-antitoxin system RelE/ParE family toxin [Gammaproteobacteria bacterium]